jgi:erythronate-4-phosphate dehydrogenase
MRIVADDKIPYLKGVLEPYANVVYLPGDHINADSLKNTNALLTRSITKCNKNLLQDSPLQIIVSATIGDDHIDKAFCSENNIRWATAKGCNASAVLQYVITALFKIAHLGKFELLGKTIGIIGVGNIGSRMAAVAEFLGMKVLLNDPPRAKNEGNEAFVSLDELLEASDIITLHVPLTLAGEDKTYHLCEADFFQKIKKRAVLINTSRGEVVDGSALKKVISNGKLTDIVMDVWENEPVIDKELLSLVKIGTSHIAGYSINGKARGTAMVVQQLSKFFHLGLDDWFPHIDQSKEILEMDNAAMPDQEIIHDLLSKVYPIENDDRALRQNPENFEALRRAYVFRKENDVFEIGTKEIKPDLRIKLEQLNFSI